MSAHPEDVAEQVRLDRDARDDDEPCAGGAHCCCCGPGEPCCDCGEVMPAPADVDALLRDLNARDVPNLGVLLSASRARAMAVGLELIVGGRMKAGHGWKYRRTAKGCAYLEARP